MDKEFLVIYCEVYQSSNGDEVQINHTYAWLDDYEEMVEFIDEHKEDSNYKLLNAVQISVVKDYKELIKKGEE